MNNLRTRLLAAVIATAVFVPTAIAASFQIQGIGPVAAVRGTSPPAMPATITVTTPGTTQDWTATLEGAPAWASLTATSGTGAGTVTVNFNTTALAAGTFNSALVLTSGGTVSRAAFSLTVITPNIIKMEADLNRPVIYALHRGTEPTNPPGYVIFLNTATERVELVRAAGVNPTDFDVSYPEDKLYVSNHGAAADSIRVFDLTTRQQVRTLNAGTDVYKLNAGKNGRIMTEGLDQWITVSNLNSTTGAVISSNSTPDYFSVREGDGEFDPAGRYYYHCSHNTSDAHITRYDLQADTFASAIESMQHPSGSRSLLMTGDGSRLFWQSYAYDRDLNELRSYGATIQASTFRGEVVFSDSRAYGGNTGTQLATLPVTTSIMAVSGDQTKLFLFNTATGAFSRVLMSAIGPVPPPVSVPVPADNAVVLTPLDRLQWSSAAAALSYRVYLGTDAAAVAAAGTSSPLYLGETSSLQRTLTTALTTGTTYFWRVDSVGFSGAATGPVWRFTASALVVSPNALTLKMARGVPARTIPLTTAASVAGPWTAAESISWLSLSATSGTSGYGLTATVNTAGLAAGSYSGVVSFTFGGLTATLPVSLEVFTLALTKMTADPGRPWIYGLHSGTAAQPESYVIFINTATRQIENAIQTGIGATDLSINHQEGRLYVSNWQGTSIQIVNLADQTLLSPIPCDRDVYKLNAGRAGRIYSEGEDQWVKADIINSADGSVIRSSQTPGFYFSFREGDGEVDPSGRYYYHADSTGFTKYNVSADAWTVLKTSTVASGPRNLVMSQDGSRLFAEGQVFDADLNFLRNLGREIYATTLRGELAVAGDRVLNTASGAQVATLPVTTSVSAVAGDQSALCYFSATTGTVGFVAMSSIAPVPAPGTNAQPANNAILLTPLARLSWDVVPAVLKYRVYYGTDAAAVLAATTASPQYAGETLESFWNLPAGVPAAGTTFYWRVDFVGLSATTAGTVLSFRTLAVTPGTGIVEARSIRGAPPLLVRLPITGLAATAWTASTSGAAWLRVVTPSGSTGDTLELELTPGSLAVGKYTGSVTLSAAGLSYPVAVKFGIETANYVSLLADPARPRLYALQRAATTLAGSLAVINSTTGAIERVIAVSDNPADFDLTPDNAFLYLVTRGGRKLHRINLTDWSTQERALGASSDYSDTSAHYHVAAGAGTKVYWVDGEWGPRLHTMDFATGAETGPAILANTGGTGIGDIARTGDGAALAGWTQYGWSAGSSGSGALIIDTSGASAVVGAAGFPMQRDPLDTPVLPRADGSAVFMKQFKLTPDLGSVIMQYPAEVYAVTKTSGVVFGASEAWRERTLTRVWQAPAGVSAKICAVTGDQSAFYYFNTATGALVKVLLSSLGDVPGPTPEDGEVVSAMPTELTWTPRAQALRYEVYFGTDQAGVTAAADPTSPLHLGTATQATLPFSVPFQTAGIWWWRVDALLAGSTVKGPVWRFSGKIDYVTQLSGPGTGGSEAPALALEGTTVMTGYPGYTGTSSSLGIVYVHRKQPGSEEWRLHQIIQQPPAATSSPEFGSAIAIKGDIAWIGARTDGTGGKAYEYRLDAAGLWQLTGRSLQSPAPTVGSRFGWSLLFDGTVLAVGIPYVAVNSSLEAGAVEIFETTTLTRLARLTESSPLNSAHFGAVLAMDSGVLAAGSPQRSSTSGNVEIWTRGVSTWTRTATLTQAVAGFGESLAFTGNQLLAGASSGSAGTPGKVFVYQRGTGTSWVLASQFSAAGPSRTDAYRTRLAARGAFLALGTPPTSNFPNNPGTAWLYRNTSPATWTPAAPALLASQPSSYSIYAGNVAVSGRYFAATYTSPSSSVSGVSLFLHNPAGNLPPYYTSAPILFAEAGSDYTCRLTAADENAGDRLSFSSASALPAWLYLTDHGNGTATLEGTPPAGLTGDIALAIDVLDESDDSARQSFTLKVLAAGSIPRITASSGAQTSDDGKRVTFSVIVAPGGTLTYQWYYNGILLSGQTAASLVISNVQASDAGSYKVRVTRSGVWVESDPMLLTVNQVPDRFGGDWPTFGGGTSHTGAYPATLAKHKFIPAWTVATAGTNQVATGGGRVYAVGGGYFTTGKVAAYALQTGTRLWEVALPTSYGFNPPSFHRGRVYMQRAKGTGDQPELRCLDAAAGTALWTANFSAQWENYMAPAVDDTGIYVNGGTYGGIYGFGLDGAQKFFLSLEQTSNWTPLLHGGKLYSWVAGNFREHDRNSGAVLSTLNLGTAHNGTSAADGTTAVMSSGPEIIAVDLATRRILWRNSGSNYLTPAIRNGIVYGIREGGVESFNALTGVAGRVYETRTVSNQPATGIHQPVILDDTLLVSSADTVWTFDLATGALLQRLAGGGPLTYTDGVLLASGSDGTLRTWKVNQPAVVTAPVMAATEDIPFTRDIAIADPDADALTISVTGLPAWLTAAPFSQGVVRLTGTPLNQHAGAFSFTVNANDAKSFPATLVINGSVLAVNDQPSATPPPAITADEDAVLPPLALSGVFADEEDAFTALNIAVTANSNGALFASVSITDGQLRLVLTPNASGASTLELTATDSGGLKAVTTLAVTILPVNDRPAAAPVPPVIVDEDTAIGPLSMLPVFSDVEDHYIDLTVRITGNTNPALLSRVLLSGPNLLLTAAPDANGSADITLTATDSGGLSVDTIVSVTVNPVSDAPRLVPNPAAPVIPANGAAFSYAVAPLFSDPDPGERLTYSIVTVDHPELFRTLTVDSASGLLTADWTPYAWGTAVATVRATGLDGLTLETMVTLHLDAPPAPEWRLDGAPALNRQTGLLEQRIIVKNHGPRAIAGFELWLQTGQSTALYNGMTSASLNLRTPTAPWLLPWSLPLAAGAEVTVMVELHHPARRATFDISSASPLDPLAAAYPLPPAAGTPFSISRVLQVTGGMLLEFPSEPGVSYRIEYSADNQAWSSCPIPIKSGGTRVQWLDRGPPFTATHPLTSAQRFYRVRRLP